MACHFFWISGSRLQKSQEGLFRSLVFDILRQCPELIILVCEKHPRFKPYGYEPLTWHTKDLTDLLAAVTCRDLPLRFCFLIDGLDEFDGDFDELIKTTQQLASSPDIKVCVSSRPWPCFIDAFGQNASKVIKLEDLTYNDIRKYVHGKLHANRYFLQVHASDPEYSRLVDNVVDRAQGVFLWVFLVVRSLLHGLSNGDRISDLQRRLNSLPQSLEEMFRRMLFSVDPFYQQQTARMLRMVLHSSEPLSLMAYSILDDIEDDPAIWRLLKYTELTVEKMVARNEAMIRRLEARSRGLLEAVPNRTAPSGEFFRYRIKFLHRTVRDFLATKDMAQMLNKEAGANFDPNYLLAHGLVAQLILRPVMWAGPPEVHIIQSFVEQVLHSLLYLAKTAETEGLKQLDDLLDQAELCMRDPHYKRQAWRNPWITVLHLAVEHNLLEYVQRKLNQHPLGAFNTDTTCLAGKDTLLSYAMRTEILSPDMFRLLFRHGYGPDKSKCDQTSWKQFVSTVLTTSWPTPSKSDSCRRAPRERYEALKEVTELFIAAGVDLTTNFVDVDDCKISTSDIIRSRFEMDDAQYLLSRAPPQRPQSIFSGISQWFPFAS